MKEKYQLGIVVVLGLLLAGISILFSFGSDLSFEPDLVVDTYTAVLQNDGTLTENYVYDVAYGGTYRMLFRTWDDPLAFEPWEYPHVELVRITPPAGMIGYAIDMNGNSFVTGEGAEKQRSLIKSLS
ncbi:MAG: DUF2207 domain-containing protein, partial [Methanomicrobiales archaeon]|nr:DUF2207 domain-containing protein [Methanomicrobiales archaeon]